MTTQMYANTLQDEEDPDMPAQEVKMLFQISCYLFNLCDNKALMPTIHTFSKSTHKKTGKIQKKLEKFKYENIKI